MFLGKVCASLMTWAVRQFRLDGCVMSDAGHESHAAATISHRARIACSHHPCWILHNGSHQPAAVPDNRCLVHVDHQRRSSQWRRGQCKIHPLEEGQSLRGSKNGAARRPQKWTRVIFLRIYYAFLTTQVAEKHGPKFGSATQKQTPWSLEIDTKLHLGQLGLPSEPCVASPSKT